MGNDDVVREQPASGVTPIMCAAANQSLPQSLSQSRPQLRCRPTSVTAFAPAPLRSTPDQPVPEKTVQYRLEILHALTDDEADTFVATGFAEDSSFEMGQDGLWRQTRLESDVLHDGDED